MALLAVLNDTTQVLNDPTEIQNEFNDSTLNGTISAQVSSTQAFC